jgi:hypothetical protein
MESIQDKIEKFILKNKKTQIFIPTDFLNFGSRSAIDIALKRLTENGTIKRYAQGLYGRPRYSETLKTEIIPSADEIVAAIAKRENRIVQPSGATAANMLGLSLQVPARMTYLTNGTPKKIKVQNLIIELKHASTRSLVGAGSVAGLVIQALKYLGKEGIDEKTIAKLQDILKSSDKRMLKKNINYIPAWMRPAIQSITIEKEAK